MYQRYNYLRDNFILNVQKLKKNFLFQPNKLHLQKPSGHELPGIKPFRPPTEDITQILLISNAESKKLLKIVCIISYNLGDDPDMVKEFLEINDLPDLFN